MASLGPDGLTHWGSNGMVTIFRWHFNIHFLEWKLLYPNLNFIDVCPLGSNGQYVNIGSCEWLVAYSELSHYLHQCWPSSLTQFASLSLNELNVFSAVLHVYWTWAWGGHQIIWTLGRHFEKGSLLTHWGLVTHINGFVQERCNSSALAMELHFSCTNPSMYALVKLVIIGSCDGLAPMQRQAIAWTNTDLHKQIWRKSPSKC